MTFRPLMFKPQKLQKSLLRTLVISLLSTSIVAITQVPASAEPVLLVAEAFTGPDNGVAEAVARGWSVGGSGDVCFGSTDNHTGMVDSSGNGGAEDRLRLVYNNENCETGYALYNIEQSAIAGLDIVFNMAMSGAGGNFCPNQPVDDYNNLSGGSEYPDGEAGNQQSDCQADGMVFYLKDGRNTSTGSDSLGRAGGSLGYSAQGFGEGLDGGLLGIGFDAYGNFYQNPFGGQDCYQDPSYEEAAYVTSARRSLLFRGPQGLGEDGLPNRHLGYCRINSPEDRFLTDETGDRSIGVSLPEELFTSAGRKIRITVDTTDFTMGNNGTLSVFIADTENSDWTGISPITQIEIPQALRDSQTFKFGFVAGTGGGTMNGDIWGVSVNSLRPVSSLKWRTPASNFCGVTGQYFYARLDGDLGVRPYNFSQTGDLPNGINFDYSTGELSGILQEPVGVGSTFTIRISDSSVLQPEFFRTFSITSAASCDAGLEIGNHNLINNMAENSDKLSNISYSDFDVSGYDPKWLQKWYRCDVAPTVDMSLAMQPIDPSCEFTGVQGPSYIPTPQDIGKYIAFSVNATDLDETPYVIDTPSPDTVYSVEVFDINTYTYRTVSVTSDSQSQIQISLTKDEILSGHDMELDVYATTFDTAQFTIESVIPDSVMGTVDDYFEVPLSNATWSFRVTDLDTSQTWLSDYNWNDYEGFTLDDLFNHWWWYFGANPGFVTSDSFQIEFIFSNMYGNIFTPTVLNARTVRYSDHVITSADLAPLVVNAESLVLDEEETQTWSAPDYSVLNNPTEVIETWYFCDSSPDDFGFQAASVSDPVTAAKPQDCTSILDANGDTYTASENEIGQFLVLGITAINQYGSWTSFPESLEIAFANIQELVPGTVSIAGNGKVGSTLTVVLEDWPQDSTFTYQWFCDGSEIDSATDSQYLITSADVGCDISVEVNGTKPGFTHELVSSLSIHVSAKPNYKSTSKIISGFSYLKHNLTKKMKKELLKFLHNHPTAKSISCLGITGLNWEHKPASEIRKVGKLRAQVSCKFLKQHKSSLKIRKLKNKVTSAWWPSIRSVKITLKYGTK
jgi:hypothetical protein